MLLKISSVMLALQPFDPSAAFGTGFSVGGDQRDTRWDALTEVDLAQLSGELCWHGNEKYHTGEARRRRLQREHPHAIRVGPSLAVALREEPHKFPEEWKGLCFFCDQLVVTSWPHGRCAVCFYWANDTVFVRCCRLGIGRLQNDISLLLRRMPHV
jgi:hypothetical protein